MGTIETSAQLTPFVLDLPARFMMDGATYARGGELGYDGLDFYAAGRGGVIGEVDADLVTAAFFFFAPDKVREYWDRARSVGPFSAAAKLFADCCAQWGRDHLDDETDHARLAELLARVVDGANPAGAAVFAGWRSLGAPDDAKGRVLFYANALRELRAARHAAAVIAAGIPPEVAVHTKSPQMAAFFGWELAPPDLEAWVETWKAADAMTDGAFAPTFGVLNDDEQHELVALATRAYAAAA